MINPSQTQPIWLIADDRIGQAFDLAMIDIRHRFWKHYHHITGGRARWALESLNNLGPRPFLGATRTQVEQLLACCAKDSADRDSMIAAVIPDYPKSRMQQLYPMLKMAFIRLWMERQVILPLNWTSPVNCDVVLDELIQNEAHSAKCPLLLTIRAINPTSAIGYSGAMTVNERSLRATGWLRLLLASNLYDARNLTTETAANLKERSFGCRSELGRYYTDDFSLLVATASLNPFLRDNVHKIIAESRIALRKRKEKNIISSNAKIKTGTREQMMDKTVGYLEGEDSSLDAFTETFDNSRDLNLAFKIDDSSKLPGGLALLPDVVSNFCIMVNNTFQSYIKSKRLENKQSHKSVLYALLAYCGPYLYKFFLGRDGNLNAYPTTFNDFSCALYITADHELLKTFDLDLEPPETFLQFIDKLVEINQWTPTTHYSKLIPVEEFFDYIISQSAIIPNAEKVRNTFSAENYPRTYKRWGTVKKPIPRMYFSTFISMLDSFEYLTMHLNEMADGTMNGIVGEELKLPNVSELSHSSDWSGLWGIEGMSCECLDFAALNYCPIFYHEGKPSRFKYIPRFYRISDMHINGRIEPRIIMNDVRITQLMSETGIRQQHLLWLDVERWRNHVDSSVRRPLAPLLVSTDKAHGEWTSIVSTRMIDLLDRQTAWYKRNTSTEFSQKMWYNNNKGSKFGQFRPLFRLPISRSNWPNYGSYRLILLALQYFIKTELGDNSLPDLVWYKFETKNIDEEVRYITDHSPTGLSSITATALTSDYTPHGLRAGFVSEAIKFLPPSIVGQWLTGQSEALVSFYSVFDETDMGMTHQQMLSMVLVSNQDRLAAGDFPELAAAIAKINQKMHADILNDPVNAISKHRLMSLSNFKQKSDNGLDRIIAKETSELVFNPTHICPFNNTCPREVLELLGEPNCCSACPFAIRGVAHLPAISAKKDKYKELMAGSLHMIDQYLCRKPHAQIKSELEAMERENDRFAREACLLEAIEYQLVQMHDQGFDHELTAKNREEITQHYETLDLPEEARLLKRLIDVQNFPDTNTEDLSMAVAHIRHALLMREGNIAALLGIGEDKSISMASKVSMQIASMVKAGAIDAFEVYGAISGSEEAIIRLADASNSVPKLTHLAA